MISLSIHLVFRQTRVWLGWYVDRSSGWHSPIGIFIAAVFYAALKTGSDSINLYTTVPKEIIAIIQGMIILFLAVKFIGNNTNLFDRFKKGKKEAA